MIHALARFMQADPLIQAPENTQSYNRYSYVWNNPLRLIDPTGFEGVDFEVTVYADPFGGGFIDPFDDFEVFDEPITAARLYITV